MSHKNQLRITLPNGLDSTNATIIFVFETSKHVPKTENCCVFKDKAKNTFTTRVEL